MVPTQFYGRSPRRSISQQLFPSPLVAWLAASLACGFALSPVWAGDSVAPPDPMRQRRTAVVEVFQACHDSVVNISSTQIIKVQSPMAGDGLLEQLFDLPTGSFPGGPGATREVQRTSVGSGFVVHPAGYIVTNAHVVSRTADQKVIFADKREYDAQIVAIDTERDLAVLKIRVDHPLQAIKLGRSGDLMVGETVIAIGNPLGYQNTVTAGVVSALDRTVQINQQMSFHGLIQTDASINPGNSGGPLLNVLGELIGINSAIRGDAQNIGFAIPVDQLRQALPLLIDAERRGRIVTGLRVNTDGPTTVVSVEDGSPAFHAGLAAGDLIVRINQSPVGGGADYDIALLGYKQGDALTIQFTRGGKASEATLTLGGRPRPNGAALLSQRFGIRAQPMTPETARDMNLRWINALVVNGVEQGGPAERMGMKPGDLIDHLAGYPAGNLNDIGSVLETVEPGRNVPISVLRIRGRTIYRTQTAIQAR